MDLKKGRKRNVVSIAFRRKKKLAQFSVPSTNTVCVSLVIGDQFHFYGSLRMADVIAPLNQRSLAQVQDLEW